MIFFFHLIFFTLFSKFFMLNLDVILRDEFLFFVVVVSQTAVFTPAYGSVTNVRINSCMTTPQVLRVLLNKFKIENSPDEFAIYLVHASGGECHLLHLFPVRPKKKNFSPLNNNKTCLHGPMFQSA